MKKMKNVVWFVVAVLLGACGAEEAPTVEHSTPIDVEGPLSVGGLTPTLLCSGDACRGVNVGDVGHLQQGLTGAANSTYVGYAGEDYGHGIAVDASGNQYITGETSSFGTRNAYVAKLSPAGQLLYFTYFPGSGQSIALDSSGYIYLTGWDYSAITFVAKLNPSGSAFIYYVRLSTPKLHSLAVDSVGNVYLTGNSNNTATTKDVMVAKLNASASAFVYAVTFGGSQEDYGAGIAVDSWGNAYVTGNTFSSDFPVVNAFQPSLRGNENIFIAKLSSAGTGLVYSTYLGGYSGSQIFGLTAIAVDPAGNAYVGGQALSGIPGASGCPSGGALGARLNTGGWPTYITCFSNPSWSLATSVALNTSTGVLSIAGVTQDPQFPVTGNAPQPYLAGSESDAFVAQVNSWGSLTFATYLGGTAPEWAYGAALDRSGNLYVTGFTSSSNLPWRTNSFQGSDDAFVAKFWGP